MHAQGVLPQYTSEVGKVEVKCRSWHGIGDELSFHENPDHAFEVLHCTYIYISLLVNAIRRLCASGNRHLGVEDDDTVREFVQPASGIR